MNDDRAMGITVVLTGSLVTGGADDLSDADVTLVVPDAGVATERLDDVVRRVREDPRVGSRPLDLSWMTQAQRERERRAGSSRAWLRHVAGETLCDPVAANRRDDPSAPLRPEPMDWRGVLGECRALLQCHDFFAGGSDARDAHDAVLLAAVLRTTRIADGGAEPQAAHFGLEDRVGVTSGGTAVTPPDAAAFVHEARRVRRGAAFDAGFLASARSLHRRLAGTLDALSGAFVMSEEAIHAVRARAVMARRARCLAALLVPWLPPGLIWFDETHRDYPVSRRAYESLGGTAFEDVANAHGRALRLLRQVTEVEEEALMASLREILTGATESSEVMASSPARLGR